MLKTILKTTWIAVACIAIASCSSKGNQKLAKMNQAQANQILVDGKTTQRQVRSALGDPIQMSYTNSGNEVWTYKFTKSKSKVINFIPYANIIKSGTNDENKEIVIFFDKHQIVKHHRYLESKGETSAGIAG